jgi:hypothetical protein
MQASGIDSGLQGFFCSVFQRILSELLDDLVTIGFHDAASDILVEY